MNFKLNKNNLSFPIYKSIANQIQEQILNGIIKPGDKLPTERDLSVSTEISRGTIKAAFSELQKRGVIRTIQGSGSYVNEIAPSTKKSTDELIDNFFNDMRSLGLSLQEIESKFTKRLVQLYDEVTRVKVAWIDICPEFINASMKDISQMKCINTDTFISNEISSPETVFNNYDLVVTGWPDFEELVIDKTSASEKLEKISLNLKMSCIINLAKIPQNNSTVIWSLSDNFAKVMKNTLVDFENINIVQCITGICSAETLTLALENNDTLLLPPELFTYKDSNYVDVINSFKNRGGVLIPFEFHIEKGSFVHLQDRVKEIFYQYNENNTDSIDN